ncbi:metallophosphoesterase family protein [Candidatus Protofrankia californiensis]|uniref:metallophosphoesterase family protein n=1 Tax=Candidatus Protofrankia californiensis TaxID=1839754 RepID=UPI0019D024F0|nr:metallophosphoesterase [Candidatus Protofrankia californiensis]
MSDTLPRPADDSERALGFVRASMCRWLSPTLLLGTAVRVCISGVLGSYADKREEMAALPAAPATDLSDAGELWFDYVSDLGDGFDSTYTMASLLAAPGLDLAGSPTPRGRLLVMGGDQCYPTPSITDYENKLIGPYRAALPTTASPTTPPGPDGQPEQPKLFVVPGNHDWYDGLTAFMRVFCQRSNIGGWRTEQTRSYFAVKLPHRWWLLGIDIQFDSYIDDPQRRYFLDIAEQMQAGDAVILCSAKPSWITAAEGNAEAFAVLDYFERTVIRRTGAQVRVSLAGDLHHYARYSQVDGSAQKFTAGGGGAYLSATHCLPQHLVVPPPASRAPGKTDPPTHYQLETSFPDAPASRRLAAGIVRLPAFAPGLVGLLGGIHLLLAFAIGSTAGSGTPRATGRLDAIAEGLREAGIGALFAGLVNNVPGLVLSLGVLGAGVALTKTGRTARGVAIGAAHGLAQLLLAVGLLAGVVAVVDPLPGTWLLAGVLPLVILLGGLAATELLAGYLWLADRLAGVNTNELFAAQGIADYKNLLRLHIGLDGSLTVYPVGVRTVPKRWYFSPDAASSAPWFTPVDRPVEPFLIEAPISIAHGGLPTVPPQHAPTGVEPTSS